MPDHAALVYVQRFDDAHPPTSAGAIAARLLATLIEREAPALDAFVPLKVHFGEKGNTTFLRPDNYLGIIEYLKGRGIASAWIETAVLYGGTRNRRESHLRTAVEHGFTQLPIIIADGEKGNDGYEVAINQRHFRKCHIASGFHEHRDLIVLAHFKGHLLAGFGGALKQLAMGFASKAGKMAQHVNARPLVNFFTCSKCGACVRYCPEKAIRIGRLSAKIDKRRCVGCAGCVSTCPKQALIPNFLGSFSRAFPERIAEYAHAAQLGRRTMIYVNFIMNITRGCDCEGRRMKVILPDIGVAASRDPVALDMASLDLACAAAKNPRLFRRGRRTLEYAEELGMGRREYTLVEGEEVSYRPA